MINMSCQTASEHGVGEWLFRLPLSARQHSPRARCVICLALILAPCTASAGGMFQVRGTLGAAQAISYYSASFQETVEARVSYPIPRDGILVSLAINPFENTTDANTVFTLRINGVDTELSISIPPSSTAVATTTHAGVAVSVGDLVSLESDQSASTVGNMRFTGMWEIDKVTSKSALPASARWSAFVLGSLILIVAIRSVGTRRSRRELLHKNLKG